MRPDGRTHTLSRLLTFSVVGQRRGCALLVLGAAFVPVIVGCESTPGDWAGGAGRVDATNPLVVRLSNYGKFEEAAWTHLPSIGVRYVFINVPNPEDVGAVRKRLDEHRLMPLVVRGSAAVGSPTGLDELAVQLATCEHLGVQYMFLSVKGSDKALLYERLRRAGDLARQHGVILVLETHPELGTNGDVQLETMKNVNHSNVRVNFDTGNIHFYNTDRTAPAELLKIIDYVATVEIKDHTGGEGVWNFPALGEGNVDIPGVLRILKEHRYSGPITIEVEGIKGVEWDEATTKRSIEKSVKYLRSLGAFR